MPIEYKTYGCQFKCGWRHSPLLTNIYLHERKCWYNPKNKTCITCQYGDLVHERDVHYELPDCATEEWNYRTCELDADMEFDRLKPKVHCEKWSKKGGQA